MFRKLTIVILGILLFGLIGCDIKTPEVRGLVLDAETKKPIEGAWVTATLEVYSKTVGGEVHQSFFVGKTWTDKEGKFVISPKEITMPSFPLSLRNKSGSLNVAARAISSNGYISDGVALTKIKNKTEVQLYLTSPKDEDHYFSAVQGLFLYISTGRVGVSTPPVPENERKEVFNIAIGLSESYLRTYSKPKTSDERSKYASVLRILGDLYKRKGFYQNAIDIYIKLKKFDYDRGLDGRLKEYDMQIKELEELIQKRK